MKQPDITPRENFLSANWRELVFAFLGIATFAFTPRLIHWFDPTAGTTDFGAVDILCFAAAALLTGYVAVWIIIRIVAKTIQHYLDSKNFRREWDVTTPQFRIATTLLFIGFNLWAFIAFARIVAGAK